MAFSISNTTMAGQVLEFKIDVDDPIFEEDCELWDALAKMPDIVPCDVNQRQIASLSTSASQSAAIGSIAEKTLKIALQKKLLLDSKKDYISSKDFLELFLENWAAGDLLKNEVKIRVVDCINHQTSHLCLADLNLIACPDIFNNPNLQHLISLDLKNNQLATLPPTIRKLENLKRLDVAYNRFVEFPECILEIPHLEDLVISDNALKKLPRSINGMLYLQSLDIRRNAFTSSLNLDELIKRWGINSIYKDAGVIIESREARVRKIAQTDIEMRIQQAAYCRIQPRQTLSF